MTFLRRQGEWNQGMVVIGDVLSGIVSYASDANFSDQPFWTQKRARYANSLIYTEIEHSFRVSFHFFTSSFLSIRHICASSLSFSRHACSLPFMSQRRNVGSILLTGLLNAPKRMVVRVNHEIAITCVQRNILMNHDFYIRTFRRFV